MIVRAQFCVGAGRETQCLTGELVFSQVALRLSPRPCWFGILVTRCVPQWEERRRGCGDVNPAAHCNLGAQNDCILRRPLPASSEQVDSSAHSCSIMFWSLYLVKVHPVSHSLTRNCRSIKTSLSSNNSLRTVHPKHQGTGDESSEPLTCSPIMYGNVFSLIPSRIQVRQVKLVTKIPKVRLPPTHWAGYT